MESPQEEKSPTITGSAATESGRKAQGKGARRRVWPHCSNGYETQVHTPVALIKARQNWTMPFGNKNGIMCRTSSRLILAINPLVVIRGKALAAWVEANTHTPSVWARGIYARTKRALLSDELNEWLYSPTRWWHTRTESTWGKCMSIAHSIARRRRTSCPCEETVDDSLPRRRRHTCERAGDG